MMHSRHQPPARTAASMLRDLKLAHAEVRACLGAMEALTSRGLVEKLEYTGARFLISKASMRRRSQFNAICTEIWNSASCHEAAVVEQLKAGDRALMAKSAEHVKRWTSEGIEADWAGYCEASRQVRGHMALELSAEESLLFPLLVERSGLQEKDRASRSRAA